MKNIFSNTFGFSLAALVAVLYFGTGFFYGIQMILSCLLPAITFVFVFEVINAIKDKKAEEKAKKDALTVERFDSIVKEYTK